MHWIIQDNLYREDGYTALADALRRFEIPHDVVKVVPFTEDLAADQQTVPHVAPKGAVMVAGSTTLAKIAQRRGWTPGSFMNANHDYRVWREYYGRYLLNADAKVSRFADVQPVWPVFFIRPCDDNKAFTGTVTEWREFEDWQRRVIDLNETYTSLDADTMVSYAAPKTIFREFRFFVVDGEIVGKSGYKTGTRVVYDPVVDDDVVAFARRMIEHWSPARAFVIDVALTDDGLRVVEINCINSAGFYAIDVAAFVMAIERMEFPA